MERQSDFELVNPPQSIGDDFELITPPNAPRDLGGDFELIGRESPKPPTQKPSLADAIKRALMSGEDQQPYVSPEVGAAIMKEVGAGLHREGEVSKAAIQDTAEMIRASLRRAQGLPREEDYVPGENIGTALYGEETPFTKKTADVTGPAKVLQGIGEGAAEMAPKMGIQAALASVGVPAPLAAGGVFGFTEQGFDPKQAIIMGALPLLTPVFRGLATKIASKISQNWSDAGLEAFQQAVSFAGTQAYFDLTALPDYLKMSPAEFRDKWAQQAGLNLLLHFGGLASIRKASVDQKAVEQQFREESEKLSPVIAAALARGTGEATATEQFVPRGTQPEQPNVNPQQVEAGVQTQPENRVGVGPKNVPSSGDQLLRPAEVQAETPQVRPPKISPPPYSGPLSSLIGKPVQYAGYTGVLSTEPDGTIVITSGNGPTVEIGGSQKDQTLNAGDLGVSPLTERIRPSLTDDGSVSYGDQTLRNPSINRDQSGNVASFSGITDDGRTVTIRDPESALDIGIELANRASEQRLATEPNHAQEVEQHATPLISQDPYRQLNPVVDAIDTTLRLPKKSIYRQEISQENSALAVRSLNFVIDQINASARSPAEKAKLTKPLFDLWDKIETYERERTVRTPSVENAPQTQPANEGTATPSAGKGRRVRRATTQDIIPAYEAPKAVKPEKGTTPESPVVPKIERRAKGTPEPTPVAQPTGEKVARLRSGENQGDLLANVQEDFRLAGETATDYERIQREKQAAEQRRIEAQAEQQRRQLTIPESNEPIPPSRTERGTGGQERVAPSNEQVLGSASRVSIKVPEGATQIRITDNRGKVAVRPLRDFSKSNQFRGVDIASVEAGTIDRTGKFKPLEGEVTVSDESPIKPPAAEWRESRRPNGTVEAVADLQNGRAYVFPNTPESRRQALWLHEVAVHLGLERIMKYGTPEQSRSLRRSLMAAEPFLIRYADEIAQRGGYRGHAELAKEYGFDIGTEPGRDQFLFEMLARHAEDFAGRPKPSWWTKLIGEIQLFLAKHFNIRLTAAGVEALIRAGARRAGSIPLETHTTIDASGETDFRFSRQPVKDEPTYERMTKLDPKMLPGDQNKERQYYGTANVMAARPALAAGFSALPPEVQKLLPVRGMVDVANRAISELAVSGTTLPNEPTLRKAAEAISNDPAEQSRSIVESFNNIEYVRESLADLENAMDAKERELKEAKRLKLPTVAQLQAEFDNYEAAHKFQKDWIESPEFQELEKEGADFLGLGTSERWEHGELGYPQFKDPYDPTRTWTIEPDIDQHAWERNQNKLAQVRDAIERYIVDPSVKDPARQEGMKQILAVVDQMANQSLQPALGKLAVKGHSATGTLARLFPSSDYIPEIVGGRQANAIDLLQMNAATLVDRMHNVAIRQGWKSQKATLDAAKAAGYKGTANQMVARWREDIGDPILASWNTRGGQKKHIGDWVNGHQITAKDFAALRGMKGLSDSMLEAAESISRGTSATTGGQFYPLRILDRIGGRIVERSSRDTTGLTMPQHGYGGRQFANEWLAGASNREELINRPSNWDKVLSHLWSFTDPAYRARIDSDMVDPYFALREKFDLASAPRPKNLDELADLLAAEGAAGTHDEIKARFLNEIDTAVRKFDEDWSNASKLSKASKDVKAISEENSFNRPRGERMLPQGFYRYTIATDHDIGAIPRMAQEIYAFEILKGIKQLRDSLVNKQRDLNEQIRRGVDAAEQSKKDFQDGKSLVHYAELQRIIPLLDKMAQGWQARAESNPMNPIYAGLNRVVGRISGELLKPFPTLYRNLIGAPLNETLYSVDSIRGRNALTRLRLLNPVLAGTRSAALHGKQTADLAIAVLSSTKQGREIADFIRRNKWLPDFVGNVQDSIDRRIALIEEMERLGITKANPLFKDVQRNWELLSQGGSISENLENPTQFRKALRSAGALVDIGLDIGLPITNPNALGAVAVDNLNNLRARAYLNDELATLHTRVAGAVVTRSLLGIDPRTSVLTPEEFFGITGRSSAADKRALTAVRQMWNKAGVSLDEYLTRYVQAWQKANFDIETRQHENGTTTVWKKKASPDEMPADVLTDAERNGLEFQFASRFNKAGAHNRPMWVTDEANLATKFLGYGLWQNGRIALAMARHSSDPRVIQTDTAIQAAAIMLTLGLFGITFGSNVTDEMRRWIYHREPVTKNLKDTESVGDLIVTLLKKGYPNMPVIGQTLNYLLGEVRPGSSLSAGGFQLLPISILTSIVDSISRSAQTGEVIKPALNLMRNLIPQSRIWIDKLPNVEGKTNEGNAKAILIANAPSTLPVKAQGPPAGTRQYSVVSPQVDTIVNALSRSGGPDIETATQQRAEAIQKLIGTGLTERDAANRVDQAVMSRSPYRAAFGREPTPEERNQIFARLDPRQRQIIETFENGRSAYAAATGSPAPDFVRNPRQARTASYSVGRPTGIGRVGTRLGLSRGALRSYSPTRRRSPRLATRRSSGIGRSYVRLRSRRLSRRPYRATALG